MTWKLKVTRFSRMYFQLQASMPRIKGKGSGLLPTPTTGNNRNSRNAIQKEGTAHRRHGIALGLAQVLEIAMGILPKEFKSWKQVPAYYARLLPTPLTSDATTGAVIGIKDQLRMTSGLPRKINRNGKSGSLGLARLARLLPTPTTREYRGGRDPLNLEKIGRKPTNSLGDLINVIRGKCSQLNPLFVTEMMGFPVYWVLKPFLKTSLSR